MPGETPAIVLYRPAGLDLSYSEMCHPHDGVGVDVTDESGVTAVRFRLFGHDLEKGVIHYAVPNMPALVAHTSTLGLTQATEPYVVQLLQSGIELPYRAVRSNIAEALEVLVHIERRHGQRFIRQVMSVVGYDAALDRFQLECVYERD